MRLDGCCNTTPSLSMNRIRGAPMPAHRKYFNLPESKTCPECGRDFLRPPNYGNDRWFKAELCSLSCSSRRGNRRRRDRRAADFLSVFEQYVDRTPGQGPGGECWEWTGSRDSKGYGRLGFRYKALKAHRISLFGLEDYANPLFACHRCDNPPCVRPDHLFPGSILDNNNDKVSKGRHSGNYRLTESQVVSIIADARTHSEIAKDFGVSKANIGAIKRRLTWKGLD